MDKCMRAHILYTHVHLNSLSRTNHAKYLLSVVDKRTKDQTDNTKSYYRLNQ